MQTNPKIVALLAAAESQADTRCVETYNDIKKIGKEDGLVVRKFIPWFRMAVHRHNREGLIVNGDDASEIWNMIDDLGLDPDLYADATAFEESEERLNIDAFMNVVSNDTMLPRYNANQLEAASVANSHWNNAIGQALSGMPHSNKKFTVDGKLNPQKMLQSMPKIAEIFQKEGIWWNLWINPSEKLYPTLPALAQRALNAKMRATQGISNFELYSRVCAMLSNPEIAKNPDKTEKAKVRFSNWGLSTTKEVGKVAPP